MANHPFSITISAVTGDPNGLRVVEHSAWYGKALILPRSVVPEVLNNREEFSKSAVYLLVGPSEDGTGEKLYVGEADPLRDRIQNHLAQKDFWTRLIFFTGSSDQLNKTHVKFLEARLLQLASTAKRMELENKTSPSLPSMSESERIRGEGFLRHILEILPILGVHAFDIPRRSTSEYSEQTASQKVLAQDRNLLIIRSKGVEATGFDSSDGFLVTAGSQAVLQIQPSMETHVRGYAALRRTLVANGVLRETEHCLEFNQDYVFDSPSAAAAVVLGRSANGLIEWKTSKGEVLKNLQEHQSKGGVQ